MFLLLGLAGLAGAMLYTRNSRKAGWLLLFSGLLGFPVGYAAWIPLIGFLEWVLWIPAGVLLTASGLLALITPERLRSWIGQGSETANGADGPVGKAIFVGAVFAGIGLLTVVLLFSGILLFGTEDYLKGEAGRDRDDFNNAGMAASMGRWDSALESYDDILARNQSNARAWKERGYSLEKLGRYDEANESYERARELESEDKMPQGQLEDARRDLPVNMAQNNSE
jgi:tetratricopeptide (TPR) repeat protein